MSQIQKFGPVWSASGVQGFFGEGYWFHKLWRRWGLNFTGCAFVAKTTTLFERAGNMPMRKDGITPKEFFPKCVKIYPLRGMALNAVGLSGPGADALFKDGRWQNREYPFLISFMSVAETAEKRAFEARSFSKKLSHYLPGFNASVGLQINFSCPNAGIDTEELVDEATSALNIFEGVGVPLALKFNVTAPIKAVQKISEHPACDALCVSNTVPWGKIPELIDWGKLFGANVSPLAKFGGGGLSGAPLLPLVANWMASARQAGITKHINAGGGILRERDVDVLFDAGASSVFIGSVATLRPWRVRKIIKRAHQLFDRKENSRD